MAGSRYGIRQSEKRCRNGVKFTWFKRHWFQNVGYSYFRDRMKAGERYSSARGSGRHCWRGVWSSMSRIFWILVEKKEDTMYVRFVWFFIRKQYRWLFACISVFLCITKGGKGADYCWIFTLETSFILCCSHNCPATCNHSDNRGYVSSSTRSYKLCQVDPGRISILENGLINNCCLSFVFSSRLFLVCIFSHRYWRDFGYFVRNSPTYHVGKAPIAIVFYLFCSTHVPSPVCTPWHLCPLTSLLTWCPFLFVSFLPSTS